jgi:hypothetical protein
MILLCMRPPRCRIFQNRCRQEPIDDFEDTELTKAPRFWVSSGRLLPLRRRCKSKRISGFHGAVATVG